MCSIKKYSPTTTKAYATLVFLFPYRFLCLSILCHPPPHVHKKVHQLDTTSLIETIEINFLFCNFKIITLQLKIILYTYVSSLTHNYLVLIMKKYRTNSRQIFDQQFSFVYPQWFNIPPVPLSIACARRWCFNIWAYMGILYFFKRTSTTGRVKANREERSIEFRSLYQLTGAL